jgi:two-component system, OmpR family, KDP operon response regulator KdpE
VSTILVVDDEAPLRRALCLVLRANGFGVAEAETGQAGLDALASRSFDLLILDLMLPDIDGLEVCQSLRRWSRLPVIVLSAHGEEEIKIRALRAGADDFVTKPFAAPELLARIGRALRRAAWENEPPPIIRADNGTIEIDVLRRQVLRAGDRVHLTPIEFEVLAFLARNAGRVITHAHLLSSVLGTGYADATGTLRVHIVNLRKKLEAEPARPRVITTESGIGYRLQAD